ncbi:transposase (plasmid) [Rhizobium lusitanum]|nr:transposase [Rhizobium lusitanum]
MFGGNGSAVIRSMGGQKDVVLEVSRRGKPTDKAFIEFFNGKFRAGCPDAHGFRRLDDARGEIEGWCRDYNEFRPATKC